MNNSPSPQEPSAQSMELVTALGLQSLHANKASLIDAHCAKQVKEAVARCPDCCGTGRISADQERDITEPCETCGGTGTFAGIRARANLADEMAGALERLLNTKNLLDLTPIFDAARSVLTKFNSAKAGQK